MSMSRVIIIVIGVVVALLGLGLVLSSVGVASGVHIPVIWFLELIVGLVLIGAGVWVIRGGNITA
jgi:hypothetical protein